MNKLNALLSLLEMLGDNGVDTSNPASDSISASSSITHSAIGEFVIVRSRNEGINFGRVVEADCTGIVLDEARRIWYHKPSDNDTAWYEGVANSGLHKDSKVSCMVARKIIIEAYSISLCSGAAAESIKGFPSHGS